jgi:hypothetical protein
MIRILRVGTCGVCGTGNIGVRVAASGRCVVGMCRRRRDCRGTPLAAELEWDEDEEARLQTGRETAIHEAGDEVAGGLRRKAGDLLNSACVNNARPRSCRIATSRAACGPRVLGGSWFRARCPCSRGIARAEAANGERLMTFTVLDALQRKAKCTQTMTRDAGLVER